MTTGSHQPATSMAVTSAVTGDAPRPFSDRHIGARAHETQQMLNAIGVDTLEDLVRQALPQKRAVRRRTGPGTGPG